MPPDKESDDQPTIDDFAGDGSGSGPGGSDAPDDNRIPEGMTCDECGHSDLRIKDLKTDGEKTVRRFLCKRCGYVFRPGTRLEFAMMDDACQVADLHVTGLTLKAATNRFNEMHRTKYDVKTIQRYLTMALGHIRIHVNDILMDMQYGSTWGVDETLIYGKPRRYCTAVINIETRIIIRHILTEERPDGKKIASLFSDAVLHAGMPKVVVTDGYAAYKKAVRMGLPKGTKHIDPPSGSSQVQDGKKWDNNHIESFWGKLKAFLGSASYGKWSEENIELYMLYYNFIRGHSSLTRDGKEITPAMAGGLVKKYPGFEELLLDGLTNPKAAIMYLESRKLREYVHVSSDKTRLILRIRDECQDYKYIGRMVARIDHTLKNFGFAWNEDQKCWISEDLTERRQSWVDGEIMYIDMKSFEVCERCERMALSILEVEEVFEYMQTDEGWKAHKFCKECQEKIPGYQAGPHQTKLQPGDGIDSIRAHLAEASKKLDELSRRSGKEDEPHA